MKKRKIYSCVICKPDADYCEWIFSIIQQENAFVFHEDSSNHDRYYDITPGDIIILNYKKQFVAYGEAIGVQDRVDADGWTLSIPVKEWHYHNDADRALGVGTYGILDNCYSNVRDIIKQLKERWALKRIAEINSNNELFNLLTNENNTMKTIQDKIELLEYKKQIVLQGPPGTGKTRLAKLIADEMTRADKRLTPLEYLEYIIKTFKESQKSKEEKIERENIRNQFLIAFPANRLGTIELDDYCIGKGSKNSFCYWIERKLARLGIFSPGPGGATVYGIYFEKDGSPKINTNLPNNLDSAITVLRSTLERLVTSQDIEEAQKYFRNGLILKILNSYFPDEYFPVYSHQHLRTIANYLAISTDGKDEIEINRAINAKFLDLRKNSGSNISSYDLMGVIYNKFKLKESTSPPELIEKIDRIGEYKIIQFHPAYSYEDFVRGINANANEDSAIEYKVANRIIAEMADDALARPNEKFVLIIDEINRANLPAVLGELIYALEYREESVTSMYALDDDRSLILPPNLYIIGTMNTADRSVGHIDYAIRRRFAFVPILPSDSVIDEVITNNDTLLKQAKRLYQKVAEFFTDEHLMGDFKKEDVQLGHSYFLAQSTAQLELKLEYEIKPLLREYLKDGILKSVRSETDDKDQTEIAINGLQVE